MDAIKTSTSAGNANGCDSMPLARKHSEFQRLSSELRDIGQARQNALSAWAALRDELDRQQENESSSLLHRYNLAVVRFCGNG